jgi:hypothetical protein
MCLDSCKEGVGGIVVVTPVAVEVWSSSWWNEQSHVGSERGSHVPIHCAGLCPSHQWEWAPWWGPMRLLVLPEGATHPSGKAENAPRGSGTLMMSWGSGEVETAARGAYLARDLFARLGRDKGWLSALSD